MNIDRLIKNATDHDGCSSGEYHFAKFIKSCTNYVDSANIKEVLFYTDLNTVKKILSMAEDGTLEKKIKQLNPKLMEIT